MKKFISSAILAIALATAVSAQTTPNPNCTKGHIDMPSVICTPPQARAGASLDDKTVSDDPILTTIKLIAAGILPYIF